MVRRVARARRIASTAAHRVTGDQGEVGGFDGDVAAGRDRQAESDLGEGGGVVDASACSTATLVTASSVVVAGRPSWKSRSLN
jgi:hypothetical protein